MKCQRTKSKSYEESLTSDNSTEKTRNQREQLDFQGFLFVSPEE